MAHYHLAQINIARMVAPLDSPLMEGFVSQLAAINAVADASPGFVWRLQTPDGDATSVQAFEDPRILVNMSVWESVEMLKQYVYRSAHIGPLRDRLQWFEKPAGAHLAMWWIPAGHIPSVAEARERLEFRQAAGDTPAAFSFGKLFPAPDEPESAPASLPFSLDRRLFHSALNTPNGDCDAGTRFHYRQQGARVWATYAGGRVRFGSLVAVGDPQGRLDMRYQHVDPAGQFRTGRCQATPEVLADGRVRLHEEWQWTNGDLTRGRSIVEEA